MGRPTPFHWQTLVRIVFPAIVLTSSCSSDPFVNDYSWDGGNDATTQPTVDASADAQRTDAQRTDAQIDAVDAAQAQSLTVAVISDLNGSYGSTTYDDAVHSAVGEVIKRKPDVVLSTGDMVAGQQAGLNYRAMWSGFHQAVSNPLRDANIPFAISPGNHDASGYATFAAEREIFVEQWTARRPDVAFVDDEHYPLRYAFKIQDTLFVSLDDTTVGALSNAQMTWLGKVLSEHDAAVKIVFGHVPLYPFSGEKASEIIGDAALEDLLNDHNVDLFVSGHHHAYYPGKRADLRLTGMPCLGGGPRALVGETKASARAVVMIEIEGDEIRSLDGYPTTNFGAAIARSSLPESLNSGAQKITRDDL